TFHFGDRLDDSETQANFDGNYPFGSNRKSKYQERTREVGSYRANAFGLYDMHGNVAEWCSDWYGEDYYGKSPPRDPTGPSEGSIRVIRGGGWLSFGWDSRSAHRYRDGPADRYFHLGFRVALVPSSRGGME